MWRAAYPARFFRRERLAAYKCFAAIKHIAPECPKPASDKITRNTLKRGPQPPIVR
jgi:hypothetical protein